MLCNHAQSAAMKNKTKMIGLAAVLLAPAMFLFWPPGRNKVLKDRVEAAHQDSGPPSQQLSPPTAGTATPPPNPMQALLQTPFEFYGSVLDQDGKPVPAAKVSASVLDNMMKGTPLSTTSDAGGKFMIKSKGMSLHVLVEKSGYYFVDKGGVLKPSSQGFDFGLDNGRGIYKSDAGKPVIFNLRQPVHPVALDQLRGQTKVPRDGSPILISPSKTSHIALQISCRTMEDDTQPPNAPYDWRCELVVEGGDIQEAKDEHSFVAPESGYASSAVIDMPKTLDAKTWNSRSNKTYWMRFSDGTFGKISFMMIARGDHFAVVNGFRNPSPNDRNLEPKLDTR